MAAWKRESYFRTEQKSLQPYVFDSYEEQLYSELLLDALHDPLVAHYALQLLLHFQGPELASTEDQPAVEVPYPIVVLTHVLRELVALPWPLAIKLDGRRSQRNKGLTIKSHVLDDAELWAHRRAAGGSPGGKPPGAA